LCRVRGDGAGELPVVDREDFVLDTPLAPLVLLFLFGVFQHFVTCFRSEGVAVKGLQFLFLLVPLNWGRVLCDPLLDCLSVLTKLLLEGFVVKVRRDGSEVNGL